MDLTRREALRYGSIGLAGLVLGACGGSTASSTTAAGAATGSSAGASAGTTAIKLWYWPGGLAPGVLAGAATQLQGIELVAEEIGDNFAEKLLTTMTAGTGLPDVTGIKGEDIAAFLPNADQFVDLRELGADDLKSQYLEWKWAQGSTIDGKLVGFPIDIGPTALYYRPDIYEQAGLPTDPAVVGEALGTWDAFFDAGVELINKVPGAYMVDNAAGVFSVALGQTTLRFVDQDNKFVGDQEHVKQAFDLAARSVELGINGALHFQDWNAAMDGGTLPSIIGAAWLALDIKSAATESAGKWKVAPTPGGSANIGGSFLAIPAASEVPEQAFEAITWILGPENQAMAFTESALFPSAPAAYSMDALTGADPFFGGQVTIDVFGPAAENIPVAYESPYDSALSASFYNELSNVETSGKDPAAAWDDAVSQARDLAAKEGVS